MGNFCSFNLVVVPVKLKNPNDIGKVEHGHLFSSEARNNYWYRWIFLSQKLTLLDSVSRIENGKHKLLGNKTELLDKERTSISGLAVPAE